MKTIYQKIQEFQKLKISIPRNAKAYNYKYATLDKIFEEIQDKLTELWLIVVNSLKDWELTTSIIHSESEESIASSIRINDWLKPQDVGSAITYYRRYNIGCMLNLIIEDDDDWARATGRKNTEKKQFTQKQYSELVKRAQGKNKAEVMQKVLKIQKDYEISEDGKKKLDLFLSQLQ